MIDLASREEYASNSVEDAVSCTEYRAFWVSWQGENILVGRGPFIGQGRIISATVKNKYPISSVGFKGNDTMDRWNFFRSQGSF